MKKTLLLILALVLVISLAACGGNDNGGGNSTGGNNTPSGNNSTQGNGNNNNNGGDDKPDTSLSKYEGQEWPAAYLPKGMPEYTEDHISSVVADPGEVNIMYAFTESSGKFPAYLDSLKNDGWTVKEVMDGMGNATKGKWKLTYSTGETNITLVIKYDAD